MNKQDNLFLGVLKIENFQKLWGSQILSQLAINLINFVIILKIFGRTHSTVLVSLVWLFYAIPALTFGPLSGAIVDLFVKKKVMMLATFLEAIIIILFLLVKNRLWPIYTVIFFYSSVNQFYLPAEASTLPHIVKKNFLPPANALFLFTIYGAALFGFGLAGPLINLVGQDFPFVIASAFLVVAFLLVSRLPEEKIKRQSEIQDFWPQAKEGYRFIRQNPSVLFPLLLLAFAQVIINITVVLFPALATELLGIDLHNAGPFLTIPAGIGALIGAQITTMFLKRGYRKKRFVSFGLFTAGILLPMLVLVAPSLGMFKIFSATLIAFLLGVSVVSIVIPVQTLIQETTPDHFRGRVFGVLAFLITLGSVFPVLLSAAVADFLGANTLFTIMGILILGIAFQSLREPYEVFNNHRS